MYTNKIKVFETKLREQRVVSVSVNPVLDVTGSKVWNFDQTLKWLLHRLLKLCKKMNKKAIHLNPSEKSGKRLDTKELTMNDRWEVTLMISRSKMCTWCEDMYLKTMQLNSIGPIAVCKICIILFVSTESHRSYWAVLIVFATLAIHTHSLCMLGKLPRLFLSFLGWIWAGCSGRKKYSRSRNL